MQKLYYEDQYLKKFTAEIDEIKEVGNEFHIVLNKTAFFPGGGGQRHDLGKIDEIEVLNVYEKDDLIYHVLDRKPSRIHNVKCSIDWLRRLDGMNHHLAQHILSASFFKLFNINTIAVHHGNEFSTIDFNSILTEEQVRSCEKYANDVIGESLYVEFLTPTKRELKNMKLRRDLPDTNEQIRIVKIDDLDLNACCGVHPKSTLDLRLIKIKKYEKHKKGSRIEFITGSKAVSDSLEKDSFANSMCKYLNCNEKEALNGIENLKLELKNVLNENKNISIELSNYEIKEIIENSAQINDINIIKYVYNNKTLKFVNTIISQITEKDNKIALIALVNDDKINLIFSCSKNIKNVNMGELLKDAIVLIDGRGGGNQTMAQGAGKNLLNLDNTLDYAFNKLKSIL